MFNSLIDWVSFNCMQANPEKFQAIAVGKHTHTHTHTLEMHPAPNFGSVNITYEEDVKLLDVDIDSHFCFVQFLIFVHWHGSQNYTKKMEK